MRPRVALTPNTDLSVLTPSKNNQQAGDKQGKVWFLTFTGSSFDKGQHQSFEIEFSEQSDDCNVQMQRSREIANDDIQLWIQVEDINKEQLHLIKLDSLSPERRAAREDNGRNMFMIMEEECNDDTSENFQSEAHKKLIEINSRKSPRMSSSG